MSRQSVLLVVAGIVLAIAGLLMVRSCGPGQMRTMASPARELASRIQERTAEDRSFINLLFEFPPQPENALVIVGDVPRRADAARLREIVAQLNTDGVVKVRLSVEPQR